MMEDVSQQLRETMRAEAGRRADTARKELGERVMDATGDYFPEAVRRRRRRDVAGGLVMGVAIGFLARHVLGR
ncbi:hypothetical protein VB773_10715 [Haloarculaceae archaeon H-GB2-1]|nr:hypothetical protein [Haloarculaceae archaeon H-GB1-1]MEA5407979.1 hypothetical protein [Haloarculaceae archaeon H-GB2-1]